jgi:Tfp pilus assembly protein PilN
MAGKKFHIPEVNLLPNTDDDASSTGKFLTWALSWGKKIVILTELVVVLAFLSRFYFDTEVANLSDEINHKKDIIESSVDLEKQFNKISNKLSNLAILEKQPSIVLILDQITSTVPQNVSLNQINITNNTVNFSGNASDMTLAEMVAKFRDSTSFKNLVVEKVSKGELIDVNFSASAAYVF